MKLILFFIALILFSAQGEHTSEGSDVSRASIPRALRKNNLSLQEREQVAKLRLNSLRGMIGKLTEKLKKKNAAKKAALAKRNARISSNMAKHEAKAKIQLAKLSGLKGYKGKLGLGNHMSGGPFSKPSKTTWLSKYQHRVFNEKAGARNMPLRLEIGKKLESLKKSVKIADARFLTEFLKEAGVKKIIPKVMMEAWQDAKEWIIKQQFKPFLENLKLKKMLLKKKRAMQRKREEEKANVDTADYSKLTDAESNRLNRVNNIIMSPGVDTEKMQGANNEIQFYGCVDCVAKKTAKVNYQTNIDIPKAPLSKAAKALKKKRAAEKKKKAEKKRKAALAAKKKAATAKKNGKKGKAGSQKKKDQKKKDQKAKLKKQFAEFRIKQLKKLNIDDIPLLTHFLDRYGSDRNTDDVKNFHDDVHRRLKEEAMENALSPAERNELLLAKVEALESTVAARAGVPNIVKKLAKAPPRKRYPKLPSLDPPVTKHNGDEVMKRKVAIAFGNGYLEDEFKTGRFDISHASDVDNDAMRLSDSLKKKHMTEMETKPVWTMFDGPEGDHNQIRAVQINKYRVKRPNEPLADGTKPW